MAMHGVNAISMMALSECTVKAVNALDVSCCATLVLTSFVASKDNSVHGPNAMRYGRYLHGLMESNGL